MNGASPSVSEKMEKSHHRIVKVRKKYPNEDVLFFLCSGMKVPSFFSRRAFPRFAQSCGLWRRRNRKWIAHNGRRSERNRAAGSRHLLNERRGFREISWSRSHSGRRRAISRAITSLRASLNCKNFPVDDLFVLPFLWNESIIDDEWFRQCDVSKFSFKDSEFNWVKVGLKKHIEQFFFV